MALYPGLHGNTYNEPEEDLLQSPPLRTGSRQDIETQKTWRRQLLEAQKRKKTQTAYSQQPQGTTEPSSGIRIGANIRPKSTQVLPLVTRLQQTQRATSGADTAINAKIQNQALPETEQETEPRQAPQAGQASALAALAKKKIRLYIISAILGFIAANIIPIVIILFVIVIIIGFAVQACEVAGVISETLCKFFLSIF